LTGKNLFKYIYNGYMILERTNFIKNLFENITVILESYDFKD